MAKLKSWRVRFVECRKRGRFTDREYVMAGQWHRCAMGEMLGFPRHEPQMIWIENDLPDELIRLAGAFTYYVDNDDSTRAEECFDKIEEKYAAYVAEKLAQKRPETQKPRKARRGTISAQTIPG